VGLAEPVLPVAVVAVVEVAELVLVLPEVKVVTPV
jgi:hypothetical protein